MTLRLQTLPSGGIAPLDLKDAAGEKSSDSTIGDLRSLMQNLEAKLHALFYGEDKTQPEVVKMAEVVAAREDIRKYIEYLNEGTLSY
ncbi:MAG: hypothetical protein LBD42_05660 [Desulfovibrio sp.]|jgi:hypothetical protein|nr:hypothetical protein [Desulfovibrio sp.]